MGNMNINIFPPPSQTHAPPPRPRGRPRSHSGSGGPVRFRRQTDNISWITECLQPKIGLDSVQLGPLPWFAP